MEMADISYRVSTDKSVQRHFFRNVFHGAGWTLFDLIFSKGIPLVVIILLARVLGPGEFGLYGILVIFVMIGMLLTENGITSSLIRHHRLKQIDYSTVFYLNIIFTTLVYFLVYLLAPLIAAFFNTPILSPLIRLIAITFPLGAITAVHQAILNKKMRFRKIAFINLPGAVLGGCLGLWLAYHHVGIMSVVYMTLATQLITSILLWLTISWRPSWEYSGIRARMHFAFGINLLLSGLIDTLFRNSYNIVIGKFYPIQTLAFFERARSLQEYPAIAITGITNKVSYPIMARHHHESHEGHALFRQLIRLTFFLNTPLMFLLAGLASPLFQLLLGREWLPAVPYFQVLCIGSIFYPHHAYNLNVLKVRGRSDLFLRLEIIKKSAMILILLFTAPFGLMTMLWGIVISSIVVLYINIYYSGTFISYSFREQMIDLLPNLLIGLSCFLLTWFFSHVLLGTESVIIMCISGLVGTVGYFILNFLFNQSEFLQHFNLLTNQ